MDDQQMQAELERHHAQSYAWALACCSRNPLEAEEVLQKVYVKVLAGSARFGAQSSFRTWLFVLIRNTAADEWRRRQRRAATLAEYQDTLPMVETNTPGAALESTEGQAALGQAMARLPARQQEVLRLVFYHDLTIAEAAVVMGVSLGTARTHYERAKEHLRAGLPSLQNVL